MHAEKAYGDLIAFIGSTELPAVIESYDWSTVGRGGSGVVVDVGGGHGHAMSALSLAHPRLRCINLDVEDVIATAPTLDGVTHVAGDMFDARTIPPCDVVLMKHVLADWDDGHAVQALRACAAAVGGDGGGRLVIADVALPVGPDANGSADLNLGVDALLALVGNRTERRLTPCMPFLPWACIPSTILPWACIPCT